MTPTESALLAAIAAAPTDHLLRGVLADWYDDEQRHDEADAVRATKAKVPTCVRTGRWVWYFSPGHSAMADFIDSLVGDYAIADPYFKVMHPERQGLPTYPTFTAALLDLIRAWCAVHRSEVPAVDGVSV